MGFITDLPISANYKSDSYNSILVIVNCLMKIVHYQPVKIMIHILGLAKVIINIVVHYHGVTASIFRN